MTENSRIMLVPSEAPPPLEIYEQEKIHPFNQALLDERLARFKILKRSERKKLEKRRKWLAQKLNDANFKLLWDKREELWADFTAIRAHYQALRNVYRDALAGEWPETSLPLRPRLQQLQDDGRKLALSGSFLNRRIDQLWPQALEYEDIARQLEATAKAIREQDEELFQEKRFRQEARIIEQLLLDEFAKTPGCHYVWYDGKGHRRVEIPRFQRSGIDADSHWFLLAASQKERFGWRSLLPYSVKINDLTSESTLENLSVAVGRQVEVRRTADNTQIYFRVNRLDSPDGLPKYFVYRKMFELYPERERDLMPFPLGVFENRRVRWANLAENPHVLVAGKTQHGKSNFLNCMISTWIQMHSPAELRLVLVDFKGGVEFSHFKDVPHLWGDFVKSAPELMPRLREIRKVINERLALLEASGKKDIYAYNTAVDESHRLPHIVIFMDEMQTITGKAKWTRQVHHSIATIAMLGRAPGVHLVLCTQHPSKETIPTAIKGQMALLVLFLMSQHTAMTLFSETAPSHLPPHVAGRASIASGMEISEAQTPFIDVAAIADAVKFAIDHFKPVSAAAPALPAGTEDDADDIDAVHPGIDESDLIQIALDNFGGDLKVRRIFDQLKTSHTVTLSRIGEMAKKLIKAGTIDYAGDRYQLLKQPGNFYRLVPMQSSTDAQLHDEAVPTSQAMQLTETEVIAS